MKGREAVKKVVCWCHGLPPTKKQGNADTDKAIEILLDAGWLPPETIASEYVKKDKVIGTRIINKRNKPDCWKSGCALSCPDENRDGKCIDIKPKTVADLIGGKKG